MLIEKKQLCWIIDITRRTNNKGNKEKIDKKKRKVDKYNRLAREFKQMW